MMQLKYSSQYFVEHKSQRKGWILSCIIEVEDIEGWGDGMKRR
jgi:hypothetical protein